MARAAGANVPESIKINSNLAVRRIGLEQIVFKTGKKRIGYSRKVCKLGVSSQELREEPRRTQRHTRLQSAIL
jgi:hypothetical protein